MNATQQLAEMAFNILGPIMAALGTLLACKLVATLSAKWKIDVTEKTQRTINELVYQGIALAEEMARKAVKLKTAQLTGPEKLEIAAGHVLELIQKYKLDTRAGEWTRDKVKDLIHAELPETRPAARAGDLRTVP